MNKHKVFGRVEKYTVASTWNASVYRSKERYEEVKYDSRSRRLSTSRTKVNVKEVKHVVCGNRQLIVQMIISQLGVKKESVCKIIIGDLGKQKVSAKLELRLMNDNLKKRRTQVYEDIIEREDLLRRVITAEKTWSFESDPETKYRRCQWKSSTSLRPKKARQNQK